MNTKGYREREVKFELEILEFSSAQHAIEDILGARAKSYYPKCATIDNYYCAKARNSFLRLRDSWGETSSGEAVTLKELTVKTKDKKTNFNRREVNVAVSSVDDATELLVTAVGLPKFTITKQEAIWFCRSGAVISLARVNNTQPLYLEIEGPSKAIVDRYKRLLAPVLVHATQEKRSFFELAQST